MVKDTQTIRQQFANKLFECVWPFCGIGALRVKMIIKMVIPKPWEMAVQHIRGVNQINQTHKWSCKIWSIAVFLGLKEQNFYYFRIIAKSVNTLTERLSPVKTERKRFIFLIIATYNLNIINIISKVIVDIFLNHSL